VRRKYAALREHCALLGRPYGSVLRTFYPNLVLAETAAGVQAKLGARAGGRPMVELPRTPGMPRELRTHYALPTPDEIPLLIVAGTPEEVTTYLRVLVDAGVQYVIVSGGDADTVRLLSEQVMPQFRGG
jgi:alkanesulfonate monooxygenase SsuD/methylene tetrahydromethanopterin reductase-like flavin-dependent oxidoreductase (luciferase family)